MHLIGVGGMREVIKSAAPKRRPGWDRRTPLRSPGRFTSPPLRRPRAFRRADRPAPIGLPSDYHRDTTRLTLGRSWAALGALLGRSWAALARSSALSARFLRPTSSEDREIRQLGHDLLRFYRILGDLGQFGESKHIDFCEFSMVFRSSWPVCSKRRRLTKNIQKH